MKIVTIIRFTHTDGDGNVLLHVQQSGTEFHFTLNRDEVLLALTQLSAAIADEYCDGKNFPLSNKHLNETP